jgi:hypothetical protein
MNEYSQLFLTSPQGLFSMERHSRDKSICFSEKDPEDVKKCSNSIITSGSIS